MKAGRRRGDISKTKLSLLFVSNLAFITSVLSAPAIAGSWSITSTITENLSFDDNIQLEEDDSGSTFGSTTNINNTIGFARRTLNFQLNSGLGLRGFVGPGTDDDNDLNSFDQSYDASLSKQFKNLTFNLGGAFSVSDTVFSEFDESGILDENETSRFSITGTSGVTYALDRLTSLSLNGSINDVSFSDGSDQFTPFTSTTLTGAITRRLTKKVNIRFSERWTVFSPEGIAATESQTLASTVGFDVQLTKKLNLSVGGGLAVISQDITDDTSVTTLSNEFDIDLGYRLANTSFGISFARSNDPSSLGELQSNDRLQLSAQHQINDISSLSFSASAARRESAGEFLSTDRETLSVSSSYSRRFNDNWRANLGYTFRFQEDDDSSASSNNINFSITRSLNIQP